MPKDEVTISPVSRSKQEAQATYDKISRSYDVLEWMWETRAIIAGLDKLGIRAAEFVLEIGGGTGHSLVSLGQAVTRSGRVYGLDLSARMLNISQARIRRSALSDIVHLGQGDATNLPFRTNALDAIFTSFTLELFDTPEIPKVLSECHRVLRPGGRICVVSLSQTGKSTWLRKLYTWGHQQFPKFLDCRPIFVQQALEEVGFEILEAERILLWGLPVEIVLARKQ